MEIELKLALDPAAVTRCRRHPLLAGGKPERQVLHSIYFDTPDFALTRRKIALRLRRIGYHWVQTLKAAAPAVGALSARPEWEAQVVGNTPDLTVLPAEARALLEGLPALQPVFVTDVKRTIWLLRAGGSEIEIALDQGEIRSGARTMPISEIELELKNGTPDALFTAALALLERVPLRIDSRSKAARGYQLAGAVQPAPRKAKHPQLTPEAPADETWNTLAAAALTQLVDNLPGFLEQADETEYLHQARVALRRLLGLARLRPRPAPDWPGLLRERMTLLNPARDWDVFLTETLPRLRLPHDPAFLAAVAAQAANARQVAQDALASPAFTHAVLLLGQSLLHPAAATPVSGEWAARLLEKRWKSVRRRGADLADDAARHRLRIAIKKLRYATDALASLYGPRADGTVAALEAAQNELGALNDLAVAARLMDAVVAIHPEAAFSAGQVVGHLRCASRAGKHPKSGLARDLAAIRRFWR